VPLDTALAAVFETFVVPRYLSFFGQAALDALAVGRDAQVVHLHCRTGYPDVEIAARLPGAHLYGCDPSRPAIHLARAKATAAGGLVSEYRVCPSFPVPLPDAAFSHGIALHPPAGPLHRRPLVAELARLIAPHGQIVVALPLRGSFLELADLLREFALKHESVPLAALEQGFALRPTVEMLGAELEEAGFHYVDVEVRTESLAFQSGRAAFEDPILRLLVLPELRAALPEAEADRAFSYVREAIDKYFSLGMFDLSINVGCVTGRKRPR
jgi:SAM-dependent methyltransferase